MDRKRAPAPEQRGPMPTKERRRSSFDDIDLQPTQIVRVEPKRLGLPMRGVDNADAAVDALEHVARYAHVLHPITPLQFLPPNYVVVFHCVAFEFPADHGSNGVWYKLKGGKNLPDRWALHKPAIDQLAAAAGVNTVWTRVERADRHCWHARAKVKRRTLDGSWHDAERGRAFDLRKGEPLAESMTPKQLEIARQFGDAHAESRAFNRATRAVLGIKPGYTRHECARPFVCPRLVWVPPADDPEARRLQAAVELGVVDVLYGRRDAPQRGAAPTPAPRPSSAPQSRAPEPLPPDVDYDEGWRENMDDSWRH